MGVRNVDIRFGRLSTAVAAFLSYDNGLRRIDRHDGACEGQNEDSSGTHVDEDLQFFCLG